MSILVIGGTGFIGARIVKNLIKRKEDSIENLDKLIRLCNNLG